MQVFRSLPSIDSQLLNCPPSGRSIGGPCNLTRQDAKEIQELAHYSTAGNSQRMFSSCLAVHVFQFSPWRPWPPWR